MALLTAKLSKLSSQMEDLLHHQRSHPDPEATFEAFKAEVSRSVERLVPTSNPDLQFPSLCWTKECLGILLLTTGAFTKLGVEMDLSVSRWEPDFVESYLTYSLNLLELFNSISSSLSHLGQSRLSLSLSLLDNNSPPSAAERLAPIRPQQVQVKELGADGGRRVSDGKESAINRALRLMEGVGYWVCGVVLSALSGDPKPYLESRKWAIGSECSSLVRIDLGLHELILQKGSVAREVEEINESVASLVAAIQGGAEDERKTAAAEELQSKLKGFEKLIQEVNEEVDRLFSEILRSRNEVIDCLRITKQQLF